MALRLIPSVQPYDALHQGLIDSIPAGTQWNKGPVVLPLSSSDKTPFVLTGDVGDVVEIFINNSLLITFTLTAPSSIVYLLLFPGKNFIQLRTHGETFLLLVVAATYDTLLRGYAQEFFYNVDIRFQDAYDQLNSQLSLRAVEHQISFQEMLPPTRAMRVLAGKLAVRALINETGSTRGVDDIVTAASGSTPVVYPTTVDLEIFEPGVLPLYSTAHDEGGFAFHVWMPNYCIGSWVAFIKLMDNLDPSIAELTSVSDEVVSLTFMGVPESHNFDFELSSCNTLAQECLPITVSTRLLVESEVAFCAWGYPFDTVVDLFLGSTRFDTIAPFSEVLALGSLSTDTTGSVTGVVGAAYVDLDNPISRVVSSTTITIYGSSTLAVSFIPGTRTVFFPAGDPHCAIGVRYEGARAFDSGVVFDTMEEADPLSDGWRGLPLVDRFDGGTCLDSTVPDSSLFADLDCCFDRPQSTLAVASYFELELPILSTVTAGCTVTYGVLPAQYVIDGVLDVIDGSEYVIDGV